jgi:hypothetical protein
MKLKDRYRQLQDPAFVKRMVTRSVHASMQLEAQTVPLHRVEELYEEVQREQAAKAAAPASP